MKGLSFDDLYPSRYLKASLFQGRPVTLTITDIDREELERDDGSTETKTVASFKETTKRMILNRTNAKRSGPCSATR
jgi:hypothetical protein